MRRVKSAKSRKSKSKRTAAERFGPRARRLAAGGMAGLAVFGVLAWAGQSGWFGRQAERIAAGAYGLSARAGFSVQEVLVEGRVRTEADQVLGALDVSRGAPILALDAEDARRRLEALPWVARASIERRLPDEIYVRLSERTPLALWQIDGEVSVIDRDGEVIRGIEPDRFARLPLVVGKDAPRDTAALLAMLGGAPKLSELVTAAVRVGSRRWNLRLKGGIEVRLPEKNPEEAWARLADLQSRHDLLARDVVTIDMRLPGRLLVRSGDAKPLEKRPSKGGQRT
ncbi:MAG: FtsQ-type POTRA domain-containing protein [Kiloniellales bacterium]|nr:FtsQ-type POTRA domain-containing protein [Kiloniellales bacterium]